jgi:hypothetical protein
MCFLNLILSSLERERHCWQRLPLVRPAFRSSQSLVLNLWKCLLVLDLRVFVTCLRMRKRFDFFPNYIIACSLYYLY